MAKWGECDYSELEEFHEKLEKLADETEAFFVEAAKELAARLLALVIPETPTGDYSPSSKKLGGTLRRGWTSRSHEEAANGSGKPTSENGKAFGEDLKVKKNGDIYEIVVINPVEYAPYVEFGHRTPGGEGWVSGRFFLTKSELKLGAKAQGILQKKLEKKLREVFGDG